MFNILLFFLCVQITATLATPTSADKLYLVTDASNIAIGASCVRTMQRWTQATTSVDN